MPDRRNYARASVYREAVANYAALRTGLDVTAVSPYARGKLSAAFSADESTQEDPGHLRGLPGITCLLSAAFSQAPGPVLDEAALLADQRGTVPAAIMWRRGRPVGDQLAVLRLSDLLDLTTGRAA